MPCGEGPDGDQSSLAALMAAFPIGDPGSEGVREFRWRGRRDLENFATAFQLSGLAAIGQKTEVADAHEPGGKHVEQEAPDEFAGVERHGCLAAGVLAVPVEKNHAVVFNREYPVIGNSDAVGIAAQIVQHGFR